MKDEFDDAPWDELSTRARGHEGTKIPGNKTPRNEIIGR
jgi:hypothetical protein